MEWQWLPSDTNFKYSCFAYLEMRTTTYPGILSWWRFGWPILNDPRGFRVIVKFQSFYFSLRKNCNVLLLRKPRQKRESWQLIPSEQKYLSFVQWSFTLGTHIDSRNLAAKNVKWDTLRYSPLGFTIINANTPHNSPFWFHLDYNCRSCESSIFSSDILCVSLAYSF